MSTEERKGYAAGALYALANCFSEMITKTGHGMSYALNYNLNLTGKAFNDFQERLNKAKDAFYELDEKGDKKVEKVKDKDGKEVGIYVFKPGTESEREEMLKDFDAERFDLDLKILNPQKFEKAMDEGIFDGIDVTILFELGLVE